MLFNISKHFWLLVVYVNIINVMGKNCPEGEQCTRCDYYIPEDQSKEQDYNVSTQHYFKNKGNDSGIKYIRSHVRYPNGTDIADVRITMKYSVEGTAKPNEDKRPSECYSKNINTTLELSSPLNEGFWIILKEDKHSSQLIIELSITIKKTKIPSSFLTHLQLDALQRLIIAGNKWSSPKSFSWLLPVLEELDLRDNNIKTFPDDLLVGSPRLRKLVLAKNRLTTLPIENLKKLLYLEEVDFSNQKQIETFILSDNDLDVQNINLSGCKIIQIKDTGTQTSLKTEKLDLSSNSLTEISYGTIKRFTNLLYLNLSYNKLQSCPTFTEKQLFLSFLDLSHNEISSLSSNCFSGVQELQYLNLSSNQIMLHNNEVYNSLIKLEILNLSHNGISTWPTSLETGIPAKIIDLGENLLNCCETHIRSVSNKLICTNNSSECDDVANFTYKPRTPRQMPSYGSDFWNQPLFFATIALSVLVIILISLLYWMRNKKRSECQIPIINAGNQNAEEGIRNQNHSEYENECHKPRVLTLHVYDDVGVGNLDTTELQGEIRTKKSRYILNGVKVIHTPITAQEESVDQTHTEYENEYHMPQVVTSQLIYDDVEVGKVGEMSEVQTKKSKRVLNGVKVMHIPISAQEESVDQTHTEYENEDHMPEGLTSQLIYDDVEVGKVDEVSEVQTKKSKRVLNGVKVIHTPISARRHSSVSEKSVRVYDDDEVQNLNAIE